MPTKHICLSGEMLPIDPKSEWDQLFNRIILGEKPFTTFDISRLCGVAHTTVSYWVDTGKLAAYRTPGGHRRVKRTDLLQFLKAYRFPIPEPLLEAQRKYGLQ